MGFGSTETTTGQAGPMSEQGRRAFELLYGPLGDAANQLDLRQPSERIAELDPRARGLISEIQQATGQVAQDQMTQNLRAGMRTVQDSAIGRGLSGSTLEEMLAAIMGAEQLRNANTAVNAARAEGAGMQLNVPMQLAQMDTGYNANLLASLVQGSGIGAQYDATLRGLTQTQTKETDQGIGSMLFNAGTQLGSAKLKNT